jgi:hypothetical protein
LPLDPGVDAGQLLARKNLPPLAPHPPPFDSFDKLPFDKLRVENHRDCDRLPSSLRYAEAGRVCDISTATSKLGSPPVRSASTFPASLGARLATRTFRQHLPRQPRGCG